MKLTEVIRDLRALLLITLSLPGCGEPGTAPDPGETAMVIVAGRTQTGTVGKPLDSLLVVRVTDIADRPVAGYAVRFSAPPNAGTISSSHLTDRNGLAVAHWTLPVVAGTY